MSEPLRFTLWPGCYPFRRLFVVARFKWPGVHLAYIGSDVAGNHYLQQWGNSQVFVVTSQELYSNERT
jgi:hypothetical protein